MLDREVVVKALAESNRRYMVSIQNGQTGPLCDIVAEGSRRGRPKHHVEFHFNAVGRLLDVDHAWRVPLFYPRVFLALLGFTSIVRTEDI